jgi:hypothetical protein
VLEKQALKLPKAGDLMRRMLARARHTAAKGTENLSELAYRVRHPVEGAAEGWASMSPARQLAKEELERAAKFELLTQSGFSPEEAAKRLGTSLSEQISAGKAGKHLAGAERSLLGAGGTLREGAVGERLKATAEELSRRGWTGQGGATKYMPIGGKGLMTGFGATSIPTIVNAPKATPTGEGGTAERALEDVMGTGGFILGSGLGPITGLGAGYGSMAVGKRMGRVIDRLRSGASLGQAVTAPSPTEAATQMRRIQQYYGTEQP